MIVRKSKVQEGAMCDYGKNMKNYAYETAKLLSKNILFVVNFCMGWHLCISKPVYRPKQTIFYATKQMILFYPKLN